MPNFVGLGQTMYEKSVTKSHRVKRDRQTDKNSKLKRHVSAYRAAIINRMIHATIYVQRMFDVSLYLLTKKTHEPYDKASRLVYLHVLFQLVYLC